MTRRSFLKSAWKYLGVIALLEGVWIALSMMKNKQGTSSLEERNLKTVGKLSEIPTGTLIPFRTGRFFLLRLDDGGLIAISMICSHLGCTVNWDASEGLFKCPCHSSCFDRLGNVVKSPASKGLNYHKILVKDGVILVDVENVMVRQAFDPSVVTYA